MSTTVSPTPITEHELEQVERANATTATPVVFVHGPQGLVSDAAELARAVAHLDQQAAQEQEASARPAKPRVPYWQEHDALAQRHAHANATARLRALLWLTERHPDTTNEVYRAQAARPPLNPADRTPERRRALAWAATLDRLARLHPSHFEARYRAELARTAEGQRQGAGHALALVEGDVAIT